MTHQVFINEIVKANFNLRQPKSERPTNIYLIVRINQKQAKLSTGVKVYPEHWNIKKQEAYISCRLTESDNNVAVGHISSSTAWEYQERDTMKTQ